MAWDVIGVDSIQQSAKTERIQGRTISYTLDQVYGPSSTTAELYEKSVQPVVLSSLEGYHGSVFAYGQTATGKTHTMTGTQAAPGIVPLAIQDIFDYIQHGDQAAREYLIRFSYLEIYNEQILDLLSDTTSSIRLLEGKEGVVVRGLREEVVTTPTAIFELLKKGERRRQVGSTNMNKHSSRSHAIVRIWIESKAVGAPPNGKTRASSLSLVDLAGSERLDKSGSHGALLTEAKHINTSLSALALVIEKLQAKKSSTEHIPYRDSRLTYLLRNSLGGDSKTLAIVCCSPHQAHFNESLNSIRFAAKASKVELKEANKVNV